MTVGPSQAPRTAGSNGSTRMIRRIIGSIPLAVMLPVISVLAFVSRSSVVQAQTSPGTFTFTSLGTTRTSTAVDAFEVTNTPAGGWAVAITKDVDGTSSTLSHILLVGATISSASVTISGVTRTFQRGRITSIQQVADTVPRESVNIIFATSS